MASNYGSYGIIQSKEKRELNFFDIKNISSNIDGQEIWIRARVAESRGKGKNCFICLRQRIYSVQGVLFVGDEITKEFVKYAQNISKETLIDVFGQISKTPSPVSSCSQSDVEIRIKKLFVVSASEPRLPLQLEDATRPDIGDETGGGGLAVVKLDTRLDNRVLDLRTPTSQAVFRLQAAICDEFRSNLNKRGFIEIHTPKIISAASEGGANVFEVSYFKGSAYLAQSPQLYKQMAIAADFDKVYTIGAVFRAEDSNTHRHMTEFVGLDLEMAFKFHYHEAMLTVAELMCEIFSHLQKKFQAEIEAVRRQYASEPFIFTEKPLIIQ